MPRRARALVGLLAVLIFTALLPLSTADAMTRKAGSVYRYDGCHRVMVYHKIAWNGRPIHGRFATTRYQFFTTVCR